MRKYVDCVRVTDMALAYTIVEALEKDNRYSVDFFEESHDSSRRMDGRHEIELRVFYNEKVVPAPTTGFIGEEKE